MSSPGKMKPERNTDLRILSFDDSSMSEISINCVIITLAVLVVLEAGGRQNKQK